MSAALVWLVIAGAMSWTPTSGVLEEVPTIAGADVCSLDLVAALPWTLELEGITTEHDALPEVLHGSRATEPRSESDEACGEGLERTICRLRSRESVTRTENGGVPLRLEITISDFPASRCAATTLETTLAAASPDTGLSYAWDLLLLEGPRLVRLHAECTWSEEWFGTLARELELRLEKGGRKVARKVLCRCGGGCEAMEAELPPRTDG